MLNREKSKKEGKTPNEISAHGSQSSIHKNSRTFPGNVFKTSLTFHIFPAVFDGSTMLPGIRTDEEGGKSNENVKKFPKETKFPDFSRFPRFL